MAERDGGFLRDSRGRRILKNVPAGTPPATSDILMAGTLVDAEGREIVSIDNAGASNRVSVLDNGAIGDGAVNDRAAFVSAIAAAAAFAQGGTVDFPARLYRIEGASINVPSNVALEFAPGATVDWISAGFLFRFDGSAGTAVALSANAAVGATAVSVAAGAETAFTAGQHVMVSSDAIYDPGRTETKIGELAVVDTVASGSVTLRSPLAGGAYNTADAATIQPLTMHQNGRVKGGRFVGRDNTSLAQVAIAADRTVGFTAEDVICDKMDAAGIHLIDCVAARIDRLTVERAHNTGSGYGIGVFNASQDCEVWGGRFRRCRHAFTTGKSTTRSGVGRRHGVRDCHAWDSVNSGDDFDTHAASEDITFEGCTSYDSSFTGFNIECASGSVIGCRVYRSTSHGILFANASQGASQFSCEGNWIVDSVRAGIRVTFGAPTGSGATTTAVTVRGNHVVRPGELGIYVNAPASWRYTGLAVEGNTVVAPGGLSAYHIEKVNGTINGNIARDLGASKYGFRLIDVLDTTVEGNAAHFTSTTGSSGFVLESAVNCPVTGNLAAGGGTGIRLFAASTSCTVGANRFDDCTTPYNITAPGAGHRFLDHANYAWRPSHNKLKVATYDPLLADSTGTAPNDLQPVLMKCMVPEPATLATVYAYVSGAGATLTAGSNRIGVYDSAGVLLGQTADQSANWTSTGRKTITLTAEAGQSLTLAGGRDAFVWLALLAAGTTRPGFVRKFVGFSPLLSTGLAAADGWRCGTLALVTSGNGLPASFTPSTGLSEYSVAFWIGAS